MSVIILPSSRAYSATTIGGAVSILFGGHLELTARVLRFLRKNIAGDIIVVIGGRNPPKDVEQLRHR
jgi:methylmalonyl-CoA mutase cobalamin-binding domain/chain